MSTLKITEARKQIIITMYVNSLMILRERTRFGMEYSFVRPSGNKFIEKKARLNKYHIRFLEESRLISVVWSDPMSDRLILTTKGMKAGKMLSRNYNQGMYKGKTVELEIGEMSQ